MSYFDALGATLANIWHALPVIAGYAALAVAVGAFFALAIALLCALEGDEVPPHVWVFSILAGPINALVVVAPLIQMGVLD